MWLRLRLRLLSFALNPHLMNFQGIFLCFREFLQHVAQNQILYFYAAPASTHTCAPALKKMRLRSGSATLLISIHYCETFLLTVLNKASVFYSIRSLVY
jgi:hypothetical protein